MADNNELAQIDIIGLTVMGSNITCNFAHEGHTVAVCNRSPEKTHTLIAEHGDEGSFIPSKTIEEFIASLEYPRRALIVVQAGAATDAVIDQLTDVMKPGDIVIDGGNSLYTNTIHREKAIRARGLHYVGADASDGGEGALTGPSVIPSDTKESYEFLGPLLESISAHIDGIPCYTRISSDDAGHFVKMVHNDIEYADTQVIGEAYHLLRKAAGLAPAEIANIFRKRNKGDLDSYLVEITAKILSQVDGEIGEPLVDVIVDAAGQKGTGRWAVKVALDLGIPITGIGKAMFVRALSSSLAWREAARGLPSGSLARAPEGRDAFVERVRKTLYASKIIACSQGFGEISASAKKYGWEIDRGALATIWCGGCIIRTQFLNRIKEAYNRNPELPALILDEYFRDQTTECLGAQRSIVVTTTQVGVPAPVLSSSLAYCDGLRTEHLSAALVQGQRDCFGVYAYQRVDHEDAFHTLQSGDRSEVEA